MNLQEQKEAICQRLNNIIYCAFNENGAPWCWPEDGKPINWDRDGLTLCREAEKTLSKEQYEKYGEMLFLEADKLIDMGEKGFAFLSANYESRLLALCKILFPDKFQNS